MDFLLHFFKVFIPSLLVSPCSGLSCVPSKRCVGMLTLSTSKHGLIWREALYRDNQVKFGWALIQMSVEEEMWTQTGTEGR